MNALEILKKLSLTPLPIIPVKPVDSQNDLVMDQVRDYNRDLSKVAPVSKLIAKFPEAGVLWWILAGIAYHYDKVMAIRLIEISAAIEARALGAKAFAKGEMSDNNWSTRLIDSLYWQACWSLEVGEFAAARQLFERLITLNPMDNNGARLKLTALYVHDGDEAALNRLIEQYPKCVSLDTELARAHFALESGNVREVERAILSIVTENKHALPAIVGAIPNTYRLEFGYVVRSSDEAFAALAPFTHVSGDLTNLSNLIQAIIPRNRLKSPIGTYPSPFLTGDSVAFFPEYQHLTALIDKHWDWSDTARWQSYREITEDEDADCRLTGTRR